MPFLVFPVGSFAVGDHLQSKLRIISGLGIICGTVHTSLRPKEHYDLLERTAKKRVLKETSLHRNAQPNFLMA